MFQYLNRHCCQLSPPDPFMLVVAWFRQLADESIPKPEDDDWRESMIVWVNNGPPTVRENALRAIPQPLSAEAINEVVEALDATDPRVLVAACKVAEKSGQPQFKRPLVQLVELDRVDYVYEAAIRAAKACGGGIELWRAIANSMIVKEHFVNGIGKLATGIFEIPRRSQRKSSGPFSRDERFKLREVWLAFLAEHEADIRSGKKLPLPDAAVGAKLTGAELKEKVNAVSYTLPDGTQWPPTPKAK